MQIYSYLTFDGNCRKAMTFYQKCLGGALTFQTVGESPLADKMPTQMKKCVLQAQLTSSDFIIIGTDLIPNNGLVKGNAVSLMLNCRSEEEVKSFYAKLSEEGNATHPIAETFFGAMYGDLIDKFGNNWILNFNKNNHTV